MPEVTSDPKLVAACGLYCGACKSYLSGKCPGCKDNEKAGWCKIRVCIRENQYATCADCKQFNSASECGQFNNFMAKLFGVIFRSDRQGCIDRIKQIGLEAYAAEMAEKKQQTIKRR
jgi:hypothetical protein